jgi:multiple sugar transport system substrate-binding protein
LRATAAAYREVRSVVVDWSVRSLQAFADRPVDELAETFDLLYVDHPAVGYAVAQGCLVAFDELLDSAALLDQAENSVGRSAESYVWEGRRWALATDGAAQVAAYRPDLMEGAGVAVPRTWAEVPEAADSLKGAGLRMAMPVVPVDAACSFLALCPALGEEPFTGDTGEVISAETGRAALDLLAELVSRSDPRSFEWNPPGMLDHMSEEDDIAYSPLAFGYSNYARPGFRSHAVRFAPPPAGPTGKPVGTLGGAGLAVSSRSGAVDECVRYAAFVADPRTQRGPYFDGGGQPGHRSAWTDDRVNDATSGFFRDTLAALDAAYLRPRYDGYLSFQDAAGRAVHEFLRAREDPGRTLAHLNQAYRASLLTERV